MERRVYIICGGGSFCGWGLTLSNDNGSFFFSSLRARRFVVVMVDGDGSMRVEWILGRVRGIGK